MSEEIQSHVVVLADYYVVPDDGKDHQPQTISVKVIYTIKLFKTPFIEVFVTDLLLFSYPVVVPWQV